MTDTFNTDRGVVETSEDWRGLQLRLAGKDRPYVTLRIPDKDDRSETLAEGVQIEPSSSYRGDSVDVARDLAAILAVAIDIADAHNERLTKLVEQAKAEEERKRAEAERKRAERAELLTERKELLLTELLDARVKIRERGYKSMVVCEVGAREVEDYNRETRTYESTGEWRPYWRWVNEHRRSQSLNDIVRLDVKQHGRWVTVWDDGTDDLSQWDLPLRGLAKPTEETYDQGREVETSAV